jgi:hypothetical protein
MEKKTNSQIISPSEKSSENTQPTDTPRHSGAISRKEALSKAGKYAAFTAATMMMVLSPKESPASSAQNNPNSPKKAPTWPS